MKNKAFTAESFYCFNCAIMYEIINKAKYFVCNEDDEVFPLCESCYQSAKAEENMEENNGFSLN